MGELAKTLCSLSGPDSVHGIIPEALVVHERDETFSTVDPSSGSNVPDKARWGRTTIVKDMHTRKRMMAEEVAKAGPGSGFIALSGGYGTLEELLETCTWNQLGIHSRGICILDVDNFYEGLVKWIQTAVDQGFIASSNGHIICRATDPEGALRELREYKVSNAVLKLSWGNE